MKQALFQNKLLVRKSTLHGFGVFAAKTMKPGEKIEECYAIILPKGKSSSNKILDDYYFDTKRKYALLTGFGSIYNHADEPNADYTINISKRIATIKAIRPIKKGEEIFVSYGVEWFKSRGLTPKKKK